MLRKHGICVSICPRIGVKLSTRSSTVPDPSLGYRCTLQCILSTGVMRAKCSPVASRAGQTLYVPWLGIGKGATGCSTMLVGSLSESLMMFQGGGNIKRLLQDTKHKRTIKNADAQHMG